MASQPRTQPHFENLSLLDPDGQDDIDLSTNPPPRLPDDAPLTAPGELRVIKRNGTVVPYDEDKITLALSNAFVASLSSGELKRSSSMREKVASYTDEITRVFRRRMPSGGAIHIEDIQDQVELQLMRQGEREVARNYVIYREERAKERAAAMQAGLPESLQIQMDDGSEAPLPLKSLQILVDEVCQGLKNVDAREMRERIRGDLYNTISETDLSVAGIISARSLIEHHPDYNYATARLLLASCAKQACRFLGIDFKGKLAPFYVGRKQLARLYPKAFKAFIAKAVELERLDPALQEKFDLDRLASALKPERDLQFGYLGLQTLFDRYFIHEGEVRFELPQVFFMRVSMGLSVNEENPSTRAIEFYNVLSSFLYMSSTPTLFNAGTLKPQLSSCYLSTIPDDLESIFKGLKDNALLSKWAGGLGNDWTPVRSLGSYIRGTNGVSQGVVPFMKVANDVSVAVNQGGKRKGATCAYLETWHLDIEEFLELRKNTGDDRRRTHDMNTANWVPDLFMKRVAEKADWTLFSPLDTPDLHELVGDDFRRRYEEYERMADAGEITLYKRMPAEVLWRKMLTMLFETGHPWITFKDACNLRSPQQHVGCVHSSNLCTEITLNTSKDEIAVCNLGSVNLAAHMTDEGLDHEALQKTIHTAIRMLDNVIDINFYAVPEAKNANMKHRAIGLGMMGYQHALYRLRLPFASEGAVEFADHSAEAVSYFAIEASMKLAEERGAYESFSGSLWDQGILPIDSLALLERERGSQYLNVDRSTTLDWDGLREKVQAIGMRNSNVLAIAPTATIANIIGVSPCIEPVYQNLYVKSNLSGEFTVINDHMVKDLEAQDLWDDVMRDDLKYFNGSLKHIDRIPDKVKALYATAFEIKPRWIIEAASRRQKWLDQAQSLNLWIANPSGSQLDELYRMAWRSGLKTTYYLRALSATNTEKATVDRTDLNAVSKTPETAPPQEAQACSIDDPDCEACQ